ncbi:MAG TPA: DUF456 domain-containing protein [Spirochaetota bacterium]|nr:DUF456 domain-containing protein [Spirochaetota bacterium]HOD13603.1 DUF456 domain-containing protein [Spirochaetota bacterium]HPG51633.1 DUF456 domain-containing protein [Spirochaetota bacterium]HPN14353.1 DUF456 domain-containing protein [Spirochaetota bacterium]HQL81896.1 DUF456 domain-containing protein [Spirochaetota bacterium]
MDYFLIISAVILMIAGVIGCFLPAVPGPPLNFAGLILAHLSRFCEFALSTLVILGAITVAVLLLDYIVPAWGTKKFGGSKYGTWGSIIGLIIGVFFLSIGPFGLVGIIGGPFIGAYIGEIIARKNNRDALKAAFGSFLGFLAGTFMKLALSIAMIVVFIMELV